jgi:putative PIN family toxin of toxin-antitoxin system
MNVLIDTNVVISAMIRDRLPQRIIDEIVSHDDWFWVVTRDIETEYREVLARPKFQIPVSVQESFGKFLEAVTIRVQPTTPPSFKRDPKDERFLAAALASDADYLITGDKDLLDEQPLTATRIVTPAEFAQLFGIDSKG